MWSPCCPRDPEGSSSLGKHLLKPLSVFVLDFWFILTSETSLSVLNASPRSDVFCTCLTPVCGLTSGFLCTVWAERKSWVCGGGNVFPVHGQPCLCSPGERLHQPGSPHSVTGAGDWGTDVSWLRKEVAANGRAVHTIKSLGAQIVWAVLICHSLPQRVMISASAHEIF